MLRTWFKRGICLLLVAALLPLSAACSVLKFERTTGGLVISEVVSSNKRSLIDDVVGTPDWIELTNTSDAPISLKDYGLSDNMRELHKFVFPDVTLNPGEYIVVYATNAVTSETAGESVYLAGFGLAKSGEYIFLTDTYYNLLQQLEVPELITDVSYARRDDGSYGYSGMPTPGAPNSEIVESLSALFAVQNLDAVTLSEVMPSDKTGDPWVELHNGGTSAVRMENFYLSDNESDVLKWQLPECTLEAGGYMVIYLSGLGKNATDGQTHASFKLGKSDVTVLLSDLSGGLRGKLTWDPAIPDGLSVLAGDPTVYTAEPTPGAANSTRTFQTLGSTLMDAGDPLRISEVLRKNKLSAVDADGDRSEWVELHNTTGSDLSLSGYYLSDNPDNLLKWALPDSVLQPDGYLVIFLSGKDRRSGELHASFGLGEGENAVYLTTIDGMRTDALEVSETIGTNVSVGRDESGELRYYAQPTPGYANAYGFDSADSIGFFNSEGVYISEVSAVAKAKSGVADWIELYNGGTETANLSGWYLSDDPDMPLKWRIDALAIAPGAYAVLDATSHVSRQGGNVAAFGVSPSGETLVLSDASGALVDRFETGALSVGITSGRIEGESTVSRVFFQTPTAGKANRADSAYTGYAAEPTFSRTALYQTEAFTLTLSSRTPGAVIYYTTDGSTPSTSSKRYDSGITISKNTPVRAISVAPGLLQSEAATATYLFETPHSLPVMCISGSPTDVKTVLAVTDRAKKIERAVNLQFFEEGKLGVSFNAGITVKGAGTLIYVYKSLSIHLRAAYGQSSVQYPFFDDFDIHEFSSLALRAGGQDQSAARIRDSFCSRAVQGMNIDNAQTRPVVLYVNGVYYGLYDFNEDQNKDYLASHYGVDKDAVDIIRRNQTALSGDNDEFLRVRAYALNNDLSNDAKFAKFAEWVDVAYFTDYFIAQTYFCNSDMFNQKYWRSQDYTVKWRPVYFDLDFCLDSATRNMMASYFREEGVPSANGSLTYMDIYIGLNKNRGWRMMCAERYVELIMTQFSAKRLTALLDEMSDAIRGEMPRTIQRWGNPNSMRVWEAAVTKLRTNLEKRPANALKHVKSFFGISEAQMQEWIAKYTPADA